MEAPSSTPHQSRILPRPLVPAGRDEREEGGYATDKAYAAEAEAAKCTVHPGGGCGREVGGEGAPVPTPAADDAGAQRQLRADRPRAAPPPAPTPPLRCSLCVEPEDGTATVRCGTKQREPEQAAAFCDTVGATTSVGSRSGGDLMPPLPGADPAPPPTPTPPLRDGATPSSSPYAWSSNGGGVTVGLRLAPAPRAP
jgi:hypothetical protein